MFLLSQFHRLLILLSTLSLLKRWTQLWWKMFPTSQHTKKSATQHCEAWARLRKWVTTRKLFTPQSNSTQQPVTNQQHWDWESRTAHSLTGLSLFLLVFLFIVSVVVGAFFLIILLYFGGRRRKILHKFRKSLANLSTFSGKFQQFHR